MCQHLRICEGSYLKWWNSTLICQRNDNTYSEVLNRIRTGDHTVEDIQLLRTRLTSGVVNPVQLQDPMFSSALYLLPRKEQVEEYNTQWLLELAQTTPVYEFKAEHVILESRYVPHGVTSRDVPEHLIPKDDNNCVHFKIGTGNPGNAQKKYHV